MAGTRRVDLCVEYGGLKYPIELKILQNESNRTESLTQIRDYMDKFGADAGWLVIFDKDAGKSWDEKIYMTEETADGKRVTVFLRYAPVFQNHNNHSPARSYTPS